MVSDSQAGKRSEAWLVDSCRFPCVGHRGEYTCFPLVSNIYLLLSLQFFHDRGWGLSGVFLYKASKPLHLLSWPCIFLPFPLCHLLALGIVMLWYSTTFPLLWENLLSPTQEMKSQKLSSSKPCLRLNERRWIPVSSAKILSVLSEGAAPMQCQLSPWTSEEGLSECSWSQRDIGIKHLRQSWDLCSKSITCKSGWISVYNIMPSYSTILSWRGFFLQRFI